jgi:hypothetical protein
MRLIEQFVVHDRDSVGRRAECWQEAEGCGLTYYQLENGERILLVDETTFQRVSDGGLLRRSLSKGWPRARIDS